MLLNNFDVITYLTIIIFYYPTPITYNFILSALFYINHIILHFFMYENKYNLI